MARTILTPGQRRLLVVLLATGAFLIGNAAYLFLTQPRASVLPTFYQWMLVLHVVVGLLILAPMAWFIVWHMKRALAMRNRRAIWTGIGLTVAMVGLAVTGIFIKEKANSADNAVFFQSHRVLALLVPAVFAAHRLISHHKPSRRAKWIGVGVPIALTLGFLGVHYATHPGEAPRPPLPAPNAGDGIDPWRDYWPPEGPAGGDPDNIFFPAATRTRTGGALPGRLLVDGDLLDPAQHAAELEEFGFVKGTALGSASCATCHPDVTEQWSRSVHRYSSFNNPFYRAAIEDLRAEDDGRRRSQWCAGCHDPAVMLTGKWMDEVDPTVPESQAGLTCLACHAIDGAHGVVGNGNYIVADDAPDPYLFAGAKTGVLAEIHELLIRAKPDVHKRQMLVPLHRKSEFCATCHKVSLDKPVNGYRWLRGQDEYDAWHDSGVSRNAARTFYLPEKARSCQDCHMPRVPATLGDLAAKDGMVRSHLFLGPNTAISHLIGDEEGLRDKEKFVQDSLRLDVFAVRRDGSAPVSAPDLRPVPVAPGENVELHVVVRNAGNGHTFPGGTLDSNESWIHLRISDADDASRVLFESGALDADTRYVDTDAHFYRVVFVDEDGVEADRRNPSDFRAPVHVNTIGPGTADLVRFAFSVPQDEAPRALRVEARLRWRKFNRKYTEYTYARVMAGRPVPDFPVTDLATSTVDLPVSGGGELPVAPNGAAEAWVRWNDWGIGALLQGDTVTARIAFETVDAFVPEKPDGPRNLARVALRDGDVAGALAHLRRADERRIADPQNAFFFGVALEKAGDQDGSIAAYGRALETFPNDRTIHRSLARIHYKLGDYDEAMASALRVLAIDPEDRVAHWMRFQIYRALGEEQAASAAEQAYRKFAPDESAQKWTEAYRREHPEVNREDQPVHVHRLERVR